MKFQQFAILSDMRIACFFTFIMALGNCDIRFLTFCRPNKEFNNCYYWQINRSTDYDDDNNNNNGHLQPCNSPLTSEKT